MKEAVVLVDKKGNSKGYGFVTFANASFALEAAKDPKKRIDNRVTHCNLAFKGNQIHSIYPCTQCVYLHMNYVDIMYRPQFGSNVDFACFVHVHILYMYCM